MKKIFFLTVILSLSACSSAYKQPAVGAASAVIQVNNKVTRDAITREGQNYKIKHGHKDRGFISDASTLVTSMKIKLATTLGKKSGISLVDGVKTSTFTKFQDNIRLTPGKHRITVTSVLDQLKSYSFDYNFSAGERYVLDIEPKELTRLKAVLKNSRNQTVYSSE